MSLKVDFHCHSHHSDGTLSVTELATIAKEQSFKYFSITDHDCFESNFELQNELRDSSVQFVSGIELSTCWNGMSVHIVGLNFDLEHPALIQAVAHQKQARMQRAEIISKRLESIGLKQGLEKILQQKSETNFVGRPDFAQLLVKENLVSDLNQAYKKHLGAGKKGDVKSQWLDFEETLRAINQAGGIAVLAHPLHYKVTNSKLKRLLKNFKSLGGKAMEVVSGYQNSEKTTYLKSLCNDFKLISSIGSDFHSPIAWRHLGCDAELLSGTSPIWNHFVAR